MSGQVSQFFNASDDDNEMLPLTPSTENPPKPSWKPRNVLNIFGAGWEFLGTVIICTLNIMLLVKRIFDLKDETILFMISIPVFLLNTVFAASSAYNHRIKIRQLHNDSISSELSNDETSEVSEEKTGIIGMFAEEWQIIKSFTCTQRLTLPGHFIIHLSEESSYGLVPLNIADAGMALSAPFYFGISFLIIAIAIIAALNELFACHHAVHSYNQEEEEEETTLTRTFSA